MKKQTKKEFDKEILRVKTTYLEDHRKYNWSYTHDLVSFGSYHIFFITNGKVATLIKFDEEFGSIDTSNIGMSMIDKLKTMQSTLEGNPS